MANGAVSKFKRLYEGVYEFLSEKWIETQEERQLSGIHRFAHFWLMVFKGFSRNRCPLRATALAYTTLLALVPLLAVGVSITSSLLQERGVQATRDMIKGFVDTAVPQLKLMPKNPDRPDDPQKVVVDRITQFITQMNTKTLGVTGVVGLIMVGILLLSTIEDTFNDIWGVTRGRSWMRRIVHYWTTISLGPDCAGIGDCARRHGVSRGWEAGYHEVRFCCSIAPFIRAGEHRVCAGLQTYA